MTGMVAISLPAQSIQPEVRVHIDPEPDYCEGGRQLCRENIWSLRCLGCILFSLQGFMFDTMLRIRSNLLCRRSLTVLKPAGATHFLHTTSSAAKNESGPDNAEAMERSTIADLLSGNATARNSAGRWTRSSIATLDHASH